MDFDIDAHSFLDKENGHFLLEKIRGPIRSPYSWPVKTPDIASSPSSKKNKDKNYGIAIASSSFIMRGI